jgi:lipopolysaccharide biosynthesis glycosyltransferase
MLRGIPPEMQVGIFKLFAVTLPFDRVLYVDADAIACAPFAELWETDSGKWNAIQDGAQTLIDTVPSIMKDAFVRQFPEISGKKAFNGGVIGLAPREWLELPDEYERTLLAGNYGTYHPIFDQGLMNAMIQPRVKWLPADFNVHNLFDREIPRGARIIHYAGGACKPWDARYPRHEPQYFFWLRHGLHETRPWPLLRAWLLVAAISPKRLLGRFLRQRRERRPDFRNRWDCPTGTDG